MEKRPTETDRKELLRRAARQTLREMVDPGARGGLVPAAAPPGPARTGESVRGTAAADPGPGAGPDQEVDVLVRVPGTVDDVFRLLQAPWDPRWIKPLPRTYSMDGESEEALRKLSAAFGRDKSTVVRMAVLALYAEARRRGLVD